ncbi:MAG: phage tail protein [Myxococcales bacterium]|nr:phage tail protein [Myxococcales bacterium]
MPSQPFISEISMFGCNFAPRGYSRCDGQLVSISSNTALYSLLGTTFGGDGVTTFALPDLRGRLPIHYGAAPGLTARTLGQKAGSEQVTLSILELPTHTHTLQGTSEGGTSTAPGGRLMAETPGDAYADGSPASMAAPVSTTGGSTPHENRMPFLALNICIALYGIFPSRS